MALLPRDIIELIVDNVCMDEDQPVDVAVRTALNELHLDYGDLGQFLVTVTSTAAPVVDDEPLSVVEAEGVAGRQRRALRWPRVLRTPGFVVSDLHSTAFLGSVRPRVGGVASWFRSRRPPAVPEDPAVAVVEQLLGTPRPEVSSLTDSEKPVAEHALWICGCVCEDDAPTWLIYDTTEGGFAWRRVPVRVEPLSLVEARFTAGGHADPAQVVSWLRGDTRDPWGGMGDGDEDPGVLDVLRRAIARSGGID